MKTPSTRFMFIGALLLSSAAVFVAIGIPALAIKKANHQQKDPVALTLPDLGNGVVLGIVTDVNSFTIEVVLYEPLGVVCIQHSSLQYSRNCWDVDTAPKKMQDLVKKYMEMKYVPIR